MESENQENMDINPRIFNRIAFRIIKMERDNLNTKKKDAKDMTDDVYRLIMREVDKNDD